MGALPFVATCAGIAWLLFTAMRRIADSDLCAPMVAAGIVVALVLVGDLAFGHDLVLLGLPGFAASYVVILGLVIPDAVVRTPVATSCLFTVSWVVNTVLLGLLLARGVRWMRGRPTHRAGITAATIAAFGSAAALAASSCLSATPPKTPNQREAERHAPRVVVPPPVGERTPRPAPAD